MKKIYGMIIGLVIILLLSVGINVYQALPKQMITIEEEHDWLGYYKDYAHNKTYFGSQMAYYGDEDMRHYYTFDRIWMTEDEYVKLIWLDSLKWYNDSEIWVDGYGFNKSDLNITYLTVERYNLEPIEHYWKDNNTWYIAEDVINIITETIKLGNGKQLYGGTYVFKP